MRTLTADRETLTMAKTTISSKIHQALDTESDRAAKLAFHGDVLFNIFSDAGDFILTELIGRLINVDIRRRKNLSRLRATDSKDVGQTNFNSFISGEIYPCNSGH